MFYFAADLAAGYTVSAQEERPGLWTVAIEGEGRETVFFRDVQGGIEEVLRSAEELATSALRSSSVPVAGPLSWRYVSSRAARFAP